MSAPVPAPEPPNTLGPYRLLRCLAQGGMGEVYLASLEREGGFRKTVAVKRALPQLADDPRVALRFEREARLAAVLTHRHIVQVFDFGRGGGTAWLAMEYVHGVDLKAVQDRLRGDPLPPGLAVEVGLACARGLHHAHRATDAAGAAFNLVHRDVSPHNVLLSFDGDVKLTDFGLADAATGPDRPDGFIQGKYAYMSPEQARGGAVDARADQYGLAVVIVELLSGQRAFEGNEGPLATLDRVKAGRTLVPLDQLGLAPPLAEVLARAMTLEAAGRYPDMMAFAEALRVAAVAAGITAGEPPLAEFLRGLFPERSGPLTVAAPTVIHEATEAALDPIGSNGLRAGVGLDQTLDAVAPAALSPLSPTAETPQSDAAMAATPPPAVLEPARAPGKRGWVIGGLAALALGGVLLPVLLSRAPDPVGPVPSPPSSPPESAQMATAPATLGPSPGVSPSVAIAVPTAPATPPESAQPGAGGVGPPSARAAAVGSGLVPRRPALASALVAAPASAPSSGPPTGAAATASRPPADAAAMASEPPADAAVMASGPRAGVAAMASEPPTGVAAMASEPPAGVAAMASLPSKASSGVTQSGPRVRLVADGGSVRDADGAPLSSWRSLREGSLLARVVGGAGPPLGLRLTASGRNVRAHINARPYGEVRLDGVDLGGTPLADLPLRAGTRRLEVRGPDGGETRVSIEVSPDELQGSGP